MKTSNANNFIKNFQSTCTSFQDEMKVLTFAILVYDERNPQIASLLKDKSYWKALDKVSGKRLVVFAVRDLPIALPKPRGGKMKSGKKLMSNVRPIDPENIRTSYSAMIRVLLGDSHSISYPSILFFQLFEGKFYDYHIVKLKSRSQDEIYQEMSSVLTIVSDALDNIKPKYYGNRREIFRQVKTELRSYQYIATGLRIGKKIKGALELGSLLSLFIPQG